MLESPLSLEWYFGERVQEWRIGVVVERSIPPLVLVDIYWPDLMLGTDKGLYLLSEGVCIVGGGVSMLIL